MNNFFKDPMGLKLMSCNKSNPAPEPVKEPEPAPNPICCYHNAYHTCNQPFYQPPPLMYQQPMIYQQAYPSCYVVMVPPTPPSAPLKKQHECVNCSEKKKCKACVKAIIKAEESKKKYICKPTFSNPRTLAR